jgi:transcriptional regulator with XRE-family HTH domain
MTNQEVGDRIRHFRKAKGLNQDELAELALLNRVTIAKYESGKVEPGARALSRIADALDVTVDALLCRDDDQTPTDEDDVWALREQLRRDPNMRILFSTATKATPEHIRAAAAMLKALEPNTFPEDEPQEFSE